MTRIDLTPRLRAAADYMAQHGWTQNSERDDETGAVCLTGAIRHCSPDPGDFYLIRGFLRRSERGEDWNDDPERTQDEVLEVLRTVTVTDQDLQETYGPQWRQVVNLVRQAAVVTEDQILLLGAAREDARKAMSEAVRKEAKEAAWKEVLYAARETALYAARYVAGTAMDHAARRTTARTEAVVAAVNAAWGIVVRDVISAEHFDFLYGPWAVVFGPPSAD